MNDAMIMIGMKDGIKRKKRRKKTGKSIIAKEK
jgi:hypothetical protein